MDADTDFDKKLTELKSVIRALLIAEGNNETTIRKLAHLYKEQEGKEPDFRGYGYPTFYDLLVALPDTCYIRINRNGDRCVFPVSTDKTAHIISLIARQKSSKPKKSKSTCTLRSRNFNVHQQQRRRLSMINNTTSIRNTPSPITCSHVHEAMLDLRSSLTHVKTNGLRKVDVLARLRSRLGERAANYHIHNLNYHLSELCHIIDVKDDFIYFKDDKINSLPKRPNNLLNVPLNSIHVPSKPVSPAFSNFMKRVNSIINDSANHFNSTRPNGSMYNTLSSAAEKPIYSNGNKPNSYINKPSAQVPESNCNYKQLNCNGRPLQKVDDSTSQHINSASTKKNIKENGLTNGTVKDDKVKTNGSREICDLIRERTRIRLEKLVEKHPEGIWCTDLPSLYKKEYGIDLEYNELGFHSIIEFVTALPEIFTITEPGDSKKHMILSTKQLHFKDNKSEGVTQKLSTAAMYNIEEPKDLDPIPLKLSEKVSESLIPEGYMNIGETVDQIQVSSIVSNIDDDYFEAMVSEIFTPSFFWIKLRKNKKSFDRLMNRLGDFYDNIRDLQSLKIPQCILQPGLNVACIYSNIWHRAVIKKVKYDGFVVLFFYDYGTVKSYNPHNVYFLHKSFTSMPAQAIACGLHYVRPIGSKEWPKTSTDAFINRVWDLPLIASIGALHQENNTMMISLTDTSDDQVDVHINDWMVENKYAEWGKMVCKRNTFVISRYLNNQLNNDKKLGESLTNSNETIESCISSATKANLSRRRLSYSDSSEDEIIYVYNDIEREKFLKCQRLFQLYQEWFTESYDKDGNSVQIDTNDINHSNSEIFQGSIAKNENSSNISNTEETKFSTVKTRFDSSEEENSDVDEFHTALGGHGRMDPIDWSLINKKEKPRRLSLFETIKKAVLP